MLRRMCKHYERCGSYYNCADCVSHLDVKRCAWCVKPLTGSMFDSSGLCRDCLKDARDEIYENETVAYEYLENEETGTFDRLEVKK